MCPGCGARVGAQQGLRGEPGKELESVLQATGSHQKAPGSCTVRADLRYKNPLRPHSVEDGLEEDQMGSRGTN